MPLAFISSKGSSGFRSRNAGSNTNSLSPVAQMLLRLRLQQLIRALFRMFGEAHVFYIGPPKLAFRLKKDGHSSGFQEPDTCRQTKQGRYSRFLLFLIPDIVRHMPAR
jgi:hypothetical protein